MTDSISIAHQILSGDARIALAITEPEAGSDVQGLQTEAVLSGDGSHFVVNGQKKVGSPSPVTTLATRSY